MTPADIEIHQRHFLKSKDKKLFINKLFAANPGKEEKLGILVNKKSKIEWIKLGNNEELYAIDDEPAFWVKNELFIPILSYLLKHDVPFKSVVVDEGAIKFMAKGADVMRPGIIKIDSDILKNDIVLVRDPNHNRVLMVGKSKLDAEEMEQKTNGKVITCIHSLSDDIWEFSKSF